MSILPIVTVIIVVIAGGVAIAIGVAIARYMAPLTEGTVIKHRIRQAGIAYETATDQHGTTMHDVPKPVSADQRMLIKGSWGREVWVAAPPDCKRHHPIGSKYKIPPKRSER